MSPQASSDEARGAGGRAVGLLLGGCTDSGRGNEDFCADIAAAIAAGDLPAAYASTLDSLASDAPDSDPAALVVGSYSFFHEGAAGLRSVRGGRSGLPDGELRLVPMGA